MRGARLLGRLRRSPELHANVDATDAGLLARFAADRDGEAFAELVRRHGPMVRGVCHHVLGNHADADDAFQAAFLVLARKAGAIRDRQAVANWLFGVARRVATRARDKDRRRARHERRAAEYDTQTRLAEPSDLLAVLDAELERLPERFRGPVLVCLVEGRTQEGGARELGLTLSTLRRRLERGRELLRTRLARRGFPAWLAALGAAPPVGADVIEQTRGAAAAFVSGVSVAAHAAQLAEGVLVMMSRKNVRVAATAVLVAGILGGAVWQFAPATPGQDPGAKAAAAPPAPKADPPPAAPPAKDAAEERIRPGYVVFISSEGLFEKHGLNGLFSVEPSGKVALGVAYGRVVIGGMTVEEAEVAITAHLRKYAKDAAVQVSLAQNKTDENLKIRELELRVKQLELRLEEMGRAVEKLKKGGE